MNEENIDELVQGILDYLKSESKLHLLPDIVEKFEEKLEEDELRGEVVSAVPLSKEQVVKLEEILENKLHKKVKMKNIVDKEIIGGLIVRYKDIIIDQSIQGKLEEIKEEVYGH